MSTSRTSSRRLTIESPVEDIFRYLRKAYTFPPPGDNNLAGRLIHNPKFCQLLEKYHELTLSMWSMCPEMVKDVLKQINSTWQTMTAAQTRAYQVLPDKKRPKPPGPGSDTMRNFLELFVKQLEQARVRWQREGGSSRGNFGSNSSRFSEPRTSMSLAIDSERVSDIRSDSMRSPSSGEMLLDSDKHSRAARLPPCSSEPSATTRSRRSRRTESSRSFDGQHPSSDDGRFDDPDSVMLDDSPRSVRVTRTQITAAQVTAALRQSEDALVKSKVRTKRTKVPRASTAVSSVAVSTSGTGTMVTALSTHQIDLTEDSDDPMEDAFFSPTLMPPPPVIPSKNTSRHQRTEPSTSSNLPNIPGAFPNSRAPSSIAPSTTTSMSSKRKDPETTSPVDKRQKTAATRSGPAPNMAAPNPPAISRRESPPIGTPFPGAEKGQSFASTASSSSAAQSFAGRGSGFQSQNISTNPTSFETSFGGNKGASGQRVVEDADGSATEEDEVDPRTRIVGSNRRDAGKGRARESEKLDGVDGSDLILQEDQIQFEYGDVLGDDSDDDFYSAGPSHRPNIPPGRGITSINPPPSSVESLPSTLLRELAAQPDPGELWELPFHRLYEATRVALATHVGSEPSNMEKALYTYLKPLSTSNLVQFWDTMAAFAGESKLPEKINASTWTFLDSDIGIWQNDIELKGTAQFELIKDKSSVADRYRPGITMTLKPLVPKYPPEPPIGSLGEEQAQQLIRKWREDGFKLLGRTWEPFYIRENTTPHKKVSTRGMKSSKNEKANSLIFFAVSGHDIEPISIRQLVEWHISIANNTKISRAKFWSRIGLGFSDTKPSVTLDTLSDVRFSEDLKAPMREGQEKPEIMDDGCAIASPAVFQKVMQDLGLPHRPSAVQARFGGGKGVWMEAPECDEATSKSLWLEMKDSQKKFEFHSEDANPDTMDPARLTLDVCIVARTHHEASLNKQFLPILHRQGVPKEVFRELVEEDIQNEIGVLLERIEDVPYVKKWLEGRSLLKLTSSLAEASYSGSLPVGASEIARMLLDAGFNIFQCKFLADQVFLCIRDYCNKLRERWVIKVPQSAKAICVADPLGILEEGEISFNFSEVIYDKDGRAMNMAIGDVLVTRNPAHLRTDVRKVKAVDCPRLRYLKDVLVFSTKGSKSLAAYLSGGDYDGDQPWVTWDRRLVEPFENAPEPAYNFDVDDWFTKSDMAESLDELRRKLRRPSFDDRFFRVLWSEGMDSAMEQSKVGICSRMFEIETYTAKSLDTDHALLLANIVEHLLDAPKQGIKIKDNRWRWLRSMQSGKEPLYLQEIPPTRLQNAHNILDYIKFEVTWKAIHAIQTGQQERFKDVPAGDPTLTKPFNKILEVAGNMCMQGSGITNGATLTAAQQVREIKQNLLDDLYDVESEWKDFYCNKSSTPDANQDLKFKDNIYRKYVRIKPRPISFTPVPFTNVHSWMEDAEEPFSQWPLLKASTAFKRFKTEKKLVWFLAAGELCMLKARATGSPLRFVLPDIYLTMGTRKAALEAPPALIPEPDLDTPMPSNEDEFFDAAEDLSIEN